MNKTLRIGIIGDFDSSRDPQIKTNEALNHAAKQLSVAIDAVWLPTNFVGNMKDADFKKFHGFWAGPGDYANPAAALQTIKRCRQLQWPFFGT